MKAPALCAAALALCASAPAESLDLQPAGRQGPYDVYVARDDAGVETTVLAEGPLSDAQRQTLTDLDRRARSLRALRVRSARVLVTPEAIEVLVIPEAYTVEGQDLTPFLPGGLRFHVDGALSYDFRMLVGHYFLRIAGPFESEQALGARLLEAARTPAAFLKADTMAYVSERFSALDARVGEIERVGGDALRDLRALQADASSLRQQQESLRAEQAAARSELEAVKASMGDASASLVESDVQALQKRLDGFGADVEALRTAVVVLQSRNGNFSRRGVDREAIARLVELKRADPSLTEAQASEALKAQGTPMRARDISLVLGVFFSQYR